MEFGEGEAPKPHEREPDRLAKVYGIAEAYRAKYPSGDSPFAILGRILEEAGEIAAEVNHLEATGAKHDKHGGTDPRALAGEIEDLLHNVAALASYYRIESLVDEAVDETYARVVSAAATPKRTVRHKAVCYVVRDGELLVFRHVGLDWERVGVQVPAGGIEPGEDPADAAVREAREETGLEGCGWCRSWACTTTTWRRTRTSCSDATCSTWSRRGRCRSGGRAGRRGRTAG